MESDVEFQANGTTLRGWLFLPQSSQESRVPIVIMAPGYAAVKEQYLDCYARVFVEAGLAALVFDHRNFGASDGEPRQEIDPIAQIRDYQDAISFARTIKQIDHERIGVWGSSYSGGHALVLGAIDRRVKCVVAQVPTISGYANSLRRTRSDLVPQVLAAFEADRQARYEGQQPSLFPVFTDDPKVRSALPGIDAWNFYQQTLAIAPHRRNEVTLRSVELARSYEPGIYAPRISPTPLLMIVATDDVITPTDLALGAYQAALEPKKLVLIPGGHFTPYIEHFAVASVAARDWFATHLVRPAPTPAAPVARD